MPHEDYRELNAEGFARQARAAELEGEIASLAAHINAATYRLIEMQDWPTSGEIDEREKARQQLR